MKKRQRLPRHIRDTIGQNEIVRIGLSHFHWSDLYHFLLRISWPNFLILICVTYLLTNTLFAFAYLAGGNGIENAQPGSFKDAFFFSIQTMATIGYGAMYPRTPYTHLLVAVEALVGLLGFAMATGLMFARFSRPTARVLFSRVAVICPYNGVPMLMFRVANQRINWIVEAQIRVTLLLPVEVTPEGHSIRRLSDLKLVRSMTPLFSLTWVVMHPIDEESPFFPVSEDALLSMKPELIVTLMGLDETVSQTIHTRHFYRADDMLWNMRFVDVLFTTSKGDRYIDYTHFHDVTPVLPS